MDTIDIVTSVAENPHVKKSNCMSAHHLQEHNQFCYEKATFL
jgi:hypothetical protein